MAAGTIVFPVVVLGVGFVVVLVFVVGLVLVAVSFTLYFISVYSPSNTNGGSRDCPGVSGKFGRGLSVCGVRSVRARFIDSAVR